MFFRRKRSGHTEYLQIVKNERIAGKPRQSVVATLGRVDELDQDGTLERLLRSGARFSHSAVVLTAYEKGEATKLATRQLGPALAIERLWRETGCRRVISELAGERGFQFDLERAVFLTVLHRLFDPGSDRAAEKWRHGLVIDGVADLELHQLYRAMGWLGDELADQSGRGIGPRTTKDLIEERLFTLRNNLFSELSLVFLDTTSLYFEGEGGKSLGQYGHSKDHRPDLKQVVLAVVIDGTGRPICSELWPGNTTDVTTLLPVIERLKTRFLIARICIVADRGMIAADTIAELEARNLDYILGVRERATKEVRGVIADPAAWVPLSILKAADRGTTDLLVKEVIRSGVGADGKPWRRRYIVCRNDAEARKDAARRAAILTALQEALRRGDKSLVGNRGYRRFLSLKPAGALKSIPAASPSTRCSTASMSCAPIPNSPRCRSSYATATGGWSRTSFAPPSRCSLPARSSINTTKPFVAMCSARFSPWCCARSSRIAWRRPGITSNGPTSCRIWSA
jgi:hypothetical protein